MCGRCGASYDAATTPDLDGADASVPCPACGETDLKPLDPHASPFPHQPNPELLHLQHLTPMPPLPPGAMVGMGPYMPVPRPSSVPAQWAPDPAERNQWRWWNGSVWTDHVANEGVTTTDPLP